MKILIKYSIYCIIKIIITIIINGIIICQQRLVAGSIKALEDTLVWAGITPDEGPSFGGKYGPYLQVINQLVI